MNRRSPTHIVRPEEEALNAEIFDILRARGMRPEARTEIRSLVEKIAALYAPREREAIGFTDAMIERQVATLTSPWYVQLLQFDPAPVLARVGCPVLALNGEKDVQVASEENLEGIRRGLAAGGNDRVASLALPGLNHLFQHSRTGAPSEYGIIEETMSPEVLELTSNWILKLGGN